MTITGVPPKILKKSFRPPTTPGARRPCPGLSPWSTTAPAPKSASHHRMERGIAEALRPSNLEFGFRPSFVLRPSNFGFPPRSGGPSSPVSVFFQALFWPAQNAPPPPRPVLSVLTASLWAGARAWCPPETPPTRRPPPSGLLVRTDRADRAAKALQKKRHEKHNNFTRGPPEHSQSSA